MYGDKIAKLRKEANMTQSQLGDLLCVSAQAVSKWEHNLSEPDLATVKQIANIFNISMDDFLDINTDVLSNNTVVNTVYYPENVSGAVYDAVNSVREYDIGYCTNCGCRVTQDNVGVTTPKILCEDCYSDMLDEEEEKQQKRKMAISAGLEELRSRRNKSIIKASIAAAIVFILGMLISFADVSNVKNTVTCFFFFLFLTYSTFAFVFEVKIDDGPVGDILLWFVSRPIRMPGVIFTLDLDGLLFLLIAKIGLAVFGFLLGALFFVIGLFVGAIVAPFSFPFTIVKVNRKLKEE